MAPWLHCTVTPQHYIAYTSLKKTTTYQVQKKRKRSHRTRAERFSKPSRNICQESDTYPSILRLSVKKKNTECSSKNSSLRVGVAPIIKAKSCTQHNQEGAIPQNTTSDCTAICFPRQIVLMSKIHVKRSSNHHLEYLQLAHVRQFSARGGIVNHV